MPTRYGACAAPVPGFELAIADEDGSILPHNTLGDMILRLPLPPGTLTTLYNDDERYVKDYLTKYPGFYDTGDAVYVDDSEYIHIMGRNDDVINTAGHRLSTGSMEEILMEHEEVADCAVIAVNDKLKGQVPVGFVIVNAGSKVEHSTLERELVDSVRNLLGPVGKQAQHFVRYTFLPGSMLLRGSLILLNPVPFRFLQRASRKWPS